MIEIKIHTHIYVDNKWTAKIQKQEDLRVRGLKEADNNFIRSSRFLRFLVSSYPLAIPFPPHLLPYSLYIFTPFQIYPVCALWPRCAGVGKQGAALQCIGKEPLCHLQGILF